MTENTNTPNRTSSVRRFALAVGVMLGLFGGLAQTAGAEYRFYEDDFIRGGTTQAQFAGSWSGNSGLVRWWKDGSVVRGEVKSNSIVTAKPGTSPKCIAVKLRWQRITGSVGFSVPSAGSATVGITESSDGYVVSCRGASGAPRAISMNGAAFSGRSLMGLNLDVCHKATATSVWACATDANSVGGD